MEVRIRRMELRIDWLMLLLPFIAAALGEGRRMALTVLSLSAHECGHLLAAAGMHTRISRLRLTPFGAMAQIENPYSISALRLFILALSGPLSSLLVALTAAALCHWRLLNLHYGAEIVRLNLLLMLFNLLPALPLDGGRMLYALLSLRIPRPRAVSIGILFGRILSGMLLLLAVYGMLLNRRINLSPVFVAVFLLASAQDERRALTDSRLRTLMDCTRSPDEPLPVSIMAISTQTSPEAALRTAQPGRITLFAVYDRGHFSKLIDDRTLLSRILDNTAK